MNKHGKKNTYFIIKTHKQNIVCIFGYRVDVLHYLANTILRNSTKVLGDAARMPSLSRILFLAIQLDQFKYYVSEKF